MSFKLEKLIRQHIKRLAFPTAIGEQCDGKESLTYLDKNENGIGSPLLKWYNRYPDPLQWKVKQRMSDIKALSASQISLGNGCDECIDLLYRTFCEPGKDNVIVTPPTYGRYEEIGHINNVEIRKAPLLDNYQLNLAHIEQLIDEQTKIIWLCSPNDPTGNALYREDIEMVLNNFDGLVVIDEAYINFSKQKSLSASLEDYPNLVVMQTLSKAWGLAGLRVGILFASTNIVNILNKIKQPYNIGQHTQELILQALGNYAQVNYMIHHIVDMRNALTDVLKQMPMVQKIYESDANFLLVKIYNSKNVYDYLLNKGIVVYDASNLINCENCLRITIGTERENTGLIDALIEYMDEKKNINY